MSLEAIKSVYNEKHRANLHAIGLFCTRLAFAYAYPGSAALLCQDLHQMVRSGLSQQSAAVE